MGREPDGKMVKWRLSAANHRKGFKSLPCGGIVPFLIDWSPCEVPTPSDSSPSGCTLVSLRAWHPEPQVVETTLRSIGAQHCFACSEEAPCGVMQGETFRLEATLDTPKG